MSYAMVGTIRRGEGPRDRGGGRDGPGLPRALRRGDDVAVELAHADDLQASRGRILAGDRTSAARTDLL